MVMKENEKHKVYHPTEPHGIPTKSNDENDEEKIPESEIEESKDGENFGNVA